MTLSWGTGSEAASPAFRSCDIHPRWEQWDFARARRGERSAG